ncbi:MAG: hypothetical protein JJ911_00820 [Rhizobiaceae bacterium]|nr:hypothetical protein [Rhizobiaceae bacterium]
MAYSYWVTIRIKNDATYDDRYEGFVEALKEAKRKGFWSEPTSFWLVESDLGIDNFMATITAPLDSGTDLVVVRRIAHDEARYFGAVRHPEVLESFIPSAQKFE